MTASGPHAQLVERLRIVADVIGGKAEWEPIPAGDLSDTLREAAAVLERVEPPQAGVIELARRAKSAAAAPDYDEEAIRDALWAVVDAALAAQPPAPDNTQALVEALRQLSRLPVGFHSNHDDRWKENTFLRNEMSARARLARAALAAAGGDQGATR